MAKSPNLGLNITPESESTKRFLEWRTELAGTGSDSNMMIIDAAVAAAQDTADAAMAVQTNLDTHAADTNLHVTSEEKRKWNNVDLSGYVPTSRTINGQALTDDITLSAADIGAEAAGSAAASDLSNVLDSDFKAKADAAGVGVGSGGTDIELEDSVTSTSVTKAAVPNSVKTAYDKAVEAYDLAALGSGSSGNTNIYGVSTTAAATKAKVVAIDGFTRTTGSTVIVKFTITNTATSPTLNVNGTGAAAIYHNGAAISAGYLQAGGTYEFVFNGTQWDLVSDGSKQPLYSVAYGTCSTAAGTAEKAVTLAGYVLAVGSIVGVYFSYANTTTSPTLNVNGIGGRSIVIYVANYDADSGGWPVIEPGALGVGLHLFMFNGNHWYLLNPHETSSGGGRGATRVVGRADAPCNRTVADVDYLSYGDDYAAIKSAIDDVNSMGGGKVLLLEGKYSISDWIDLSNMDNLTIEGQGSGTVLSYTCGMYPFYGINNTNLCIKNLTILNYLLTEGVETAICLIDSYDTELANLRLTNCGIILEGTHCATSIHDNAISNPNRNAIASESLSGALIHNNHIDASEYGIFAMEIANSTIHNNLISSVTSCFDCYYMWDSTLNGNVMLGTTIIRAVGSSAIVGNRFAQGFGFDDNGGTEVGFNSEW